MPRKPAITAVVMSTDTDVECAEPITLRRFRDLRVSSPQLPWLRDVAIELRYNASGGTVAEMTFSVNNGDGRIFHEVQLHSDGRMYQTLRVVTPASD